MLSAISQSDPSGTSIPFEIHFIISTRELDVTLSLISNALGEQKIAPYLKIDIFSNVAEVSTPAVIEYTLHHGRMPLTFFEDRKESIHKEDTGIYLFLWLCSFRKCCDGCTAKGRRPA
jgi:hypothetical protein